MRSPVRTRLFTLGSNQWFLVAFTLLIVWPLLLVLVFWPEVNGWYAWRFEIPELEERFGFRLRQLSVPDNCGNDYLVPAFTAVDKAGPFAMAGIQPGDMPYAYHHGILDLVRILRAPPDTDVTLRVIGKKDRISQKWGAARNVTIHVPRGRSTRSLHRTPAAPPSS